MTRIGVISNPRSERAARGIAEIRAFSAGRAEILHREPGDRAQLSETLREFAAAGVEVLAIHGGDGTIQTVLTALLGEGAFPVPPKLAILPGGMTNLIAIDVGVRGSPADALARLAAARDLGAQTVRRPVLRLEGTGERPLYGMFLATAAVVRATELNRDSLHRLGIRDPLAIALIVVSLWLKYLFRRGRPNAFFRGDPIGIRLDGGADLRGDRFMLVASTLEKLVFGMRPWWGRERGAIHLTLLDFPPRAFARVVASLLRGKLPADLPANYRSHNADRIELDLDCPLTLDGEMIRPEGRPVILSAADVVDFVRA